MEVSGSVCRQVLSTPSYKENAERLRTKLSKYGGHGEAARLIEEALKNHRVSVLWLIVTVGRPFAAILARSLFACSCRLQLHVELQPERCRYLLDGAKGRITVGMLQLRNGLLTYMSAFRNVSLR